MTACWGVELSLDGEMGAVVSVRSAGDGRYRAELAFYRGATDLPGAVAVLYDAEPDTPGVFLDPMPCAGILDDLAQKVWIHRLEAVDVAAAAQQCLSAVRARLITATPHPALEQALTYAVQRPLASSFGFERRRVAADQSPLNAMAFGLWGLRRHEELTTPGVWAI